MVDLNHPLNTAFCDEGVSPWKQPFSQVQFLTLNFSARMNQNIHMQPSVAHIYRRDRVWRNSEPSTAFSNRFCHYFTPLRSFYDLRSSFSSGHTQTVTSPTDCVTAKPTYKNRNRPLFPLVLDLLKECQKLSLLGTFSGAASSSPLCQIKPGGIKALLNLLHKSVKPGLFFLELILGEIKKNTGSEMKIQTIRRALVVKQKGKCAHISHFGAINNQNIRIQKF